MNRAGEEIERSLRHQAPLSVLMIDIDHFKNFNDTYGHSTGDRVLQTVARAMQGVTSIYHICPNVSPSERAASTWPFGRAWKPLRTYSAT